MHNSGSARRRANQIHRLKNEEGEWKDWNTGLQDVILSFYRELFTASDVDWEPVIECIEHVISRDQNEILFLEVTEEEVKQALFQMHPEKSSGPDGMTPAFYQKHWSIVGRDVVELVRSFFHNGQIPVGLNDTNIMLIPKKKSPTEMGELCPISLCNVLVKVITKVMANRLKSFLNEIIENQSAFVPGRLISDNIMLSY